MKKTVLIKRLFCLLLASFLLAGVFSAPAVKTAQAAEEGESSETVRQQMVYYWHKGLPPQDGYEYPVLLVWDDKYFVEVDSEFLRQMAKAEYGAKNAYWITDPGGPRKNGGNDDKDGWIKGNYSINVGYPSESGHGLLSSLDFDYSVLKSTGTAVTFSLPNVPVMKRVAKATPNPQLGEKEEDLADRVMIGVRPTQEMIDASSPAIYKADETNWLAGFRYMDYRVSTDSILGISYDAVQNRVFRWYLHPINSYTIKDMPKTYSPLKDWTSADNITTFINKNLDHLAFYVVQEGSQYTFVNRGFRYDVGRISNSFNAQNWLRDLLNLEANLELGHVGNIFCSFGSRVLTKGRSTYSYRTGDYQTKSKFNLDVYYAEPNLMYFLKTDIVVENGQTQTLDGPLLIEEGTRITVQNGGVLSFTDWIVNKGEILIEPGGSMIVQPNTTASGLTRYCAVVGDNKEATAAGRIACDGILIVMPGCTVAGAGIYGLQFGEEAQCVNYGCLTSENWDVRTDYTVENRSDTSFIFMGWSIRDSGYQLTATTLKDNQVSLGYYQNSATIERPVGWAYGEVNNWKYRVGANFITYWNNRGGRVTP